MKDISPLNFFNLKKFLFLALTEMAPEKCVKFPLINIWVKITLMKHRDDILN